MIDLQNKTVSQKAELKSKEIAKLPFIPKFIEGDLEVEIIGKIKYIEISGSHGIEYFARAWKNGKLLGFSKDGSVEIERFRVYSPRIFIKDPNGDIIREWKDKITDKIIRSVSRYAPLDATKKCLVDTIKRVGKEDTKVIKGKIGYTTSTFYSEGGDATIDGRCYQTNFTTWALARGATSATAEDTGTENLMAAEWLGGLGFAYIIGRGFALFDISSLGTDSITSATFEMYMDSARRGDAYSDSVYLIEGSPASDTAIVDTDVDNITFTDFGNDTIANLDTNPAYNPITINATGITFLEAARDGDGIARFATVLGKDFNDSEPTVDDARNWYAYETAEAGDPVKLVIVHSSSTSIKTWNDITKSNVKTINGIAIVNIKTVNDIA